MALLQNQLKRQLLGVPDNTPGRAQAARSRQEEPDMFMLPAAPKPMPRAVAGAAAEEEGDTEGAEGASHESAEMETEGAWNEWQVWGDSESEYESENDVGEAEAESAGETDLLATGVAARGTGKVLRLDVRQVDVFTRDFDRLPLDIQYVQTEDINCLKQTSFH